MGPPSLPSLPVPCFCPACPQSVGVLTMMYTSYGGTYVSILTDQLQAILTATLITVLFIYTAATFRAPVDRSLSAVGGPLGPNKYGYSAIFSMPCSLMASTVFNDAMWQKVWAGADRRAVVMGGVGGSILVMLAVFVLGFGGWLAAWAGFINENTNINLCVRANMHFTPGCCYLLELSRPLSCIHC